MVGRGRGRRSLRSQGGGVTAVRRLQNHLTGQMITPPDHPRTFVQIPWNSWTFERSVLTDQAEQPSLLITVADIQSQIRLKCATKGVSEGNQLLIKVQSACGWATAASLIYPDLEATFYELTTPTVKDVNSNLLRATQSIRSYQRDKGTLQLPAKAGYSFPLADQKEILGNDDATMRIISCIPGDKGLILTARVHVLWQSTN
jgi:hypothetical protein